MKMAIGLLLLPMAAASAGGAFAASALAVARRELRAELWSRRLIVAAVLMLLLALVELLVAFLTTDVSLYYVWNYTERAAPLYQRFAGLYAGAAGSMLVWVSVMGGAILLWEFRQRGTGSAEMRLALAGGFFAFTLMANLLNPFLPTSAYHVDASVGFFTYQPEAVGPTPTDFRPEGFGLNPLLSTPFMVIHPPVQLTAYALSIFPFAVAVAHLLRPARTWSQTALFWGRVTWLFYATALGLGGLWAYYVLSFGGYWAWDPVEIGDLIPWLGLTVLVHTLPLYRARGMFQHFAPLLALLVFPLTLFATFITRGSLWISAHAFDVGVGAIIQNPLQRLLWVVSTKPTVSVIFGLLIATLFAVGMLYLLRFWRTLHPKSPAAWTTVAFLSLYGGLGAWALASPAGFLATALDAGAILGMGNGALGLFALAALLLAVPVALMIFKIPEGPPEELRLRDLATADNMLAGGAALLGLSLLVTVALLVFGVNLVIPQLWALYTGRAPLLVFPLALLLTVRMGLKPFGRRRALLLAGASLGLGIAGALAAPSSRLVAFGIPVLGATLIATFAQLLEVAGPRTASEMERIVGGLLMVGGVAGIVMWSSPPTVIPGLPGIRPALWWTVVGIAASLVALLMGIAVRNGRGRRAALVGGASAVVAFGYGASAVAGIAAAALLLTVAPTTGPLLHGVRKRAGLVGRYLGHVAVVFLILGYGATVLYETQTDYKDLSNPLERGVPVAFAGYTLTLVGSEGKDLDGKPGYEEVTAYVNIAKGNRVLDSAPIRFYWVEKERQYRPTEYVFRQPFADIYFNSNPAHLPSLHSERDGWIASASMARFETAGEPRQFTSDAIDKVALSVKQIPLASLVWSGAFILPFGMATVLVTDALEPKTRGEPKMTFQAEAPDATRLEAATVEP